MKVKSKKIIGYSALSAASLTSLSSLTLIEQSSAAPQSFIGSSSVKFSQGTTTAQVSITVDAGRIQSINGAVITTSGFNISGASINATLTNEALAAQSANINGVSGASYSSSAWKQSLASAIAQAGSTIGVQAVPTPTPPAPPPAPSTTPTASQTATATASASTSSTASPAPSTSASGCSTPAPITVDLTDVTSQPVPSGYPTPSGTPTPYGIPTPISTVRSDNRTTITVGQPTWQYMVQNNITTVTKTQLKTQVILCTLTPAPAPTVTVTETALPISPGAAVVKKTFTCSRTLNGKTTKKVLKAAVIKCPLGYKLVKKV
jgi:uncharacterized protein with FMN-binding domain